jgi:hypothetical protein
MEELGSSNNEVEFKALIRGLKIGEVVGVRN